MYISTDAIILKNTPYKESSVISRLFTYDYGKVSVIFKGAKKSKNNITINLPYIQNGLYFEFIFTNVILFQFWFLLGNLSQ